MVFEGSPSRLLAPLEDELAEGEVEIDEDAEDVVDLKHAADPQLPSNAKVEEHRTGGHNPYRSWCK